MSWLSNLLARFRPARTKPVKTGPVKFSSQVFPIEPFDELDVIIRHNIERTRAGLDPLAHDNDLSELAASRAAHAAAVNLAPDHLHDGFIGVAGATKSGENAAMGQQNAATVMSDWMASPGHRADILDPAFSLMGAGRAISADKVTYWFTDFSG